ncbi:6-bladed beta-propeller [Membranicola marinus]|uniref:6-bladed beta-propeller n=1 Tax=Membranihabitans marinus TaxID=1227546 RepID=A0A953HJZ0_9BACT|nr:6-bladed beta-propeller [Membranihabitans marinus]MBY5957264.1 6-bladed beta-propeller [Membranihabitans marinus]
MKTIFMLSFLPWLFFGCRHPEATDRTDTLFIPAAIFENPDPLPLSTIAKGSRYLLIDTTGGHYIKRINGLANFGDSYLIYDDQGVFYTISPQGRVLSTFQHQGKGPGEYLDIDDIAINPSNLDIYVNSSRLKKIIHYDSTGNLLHELSVKNYYINELTFKDGHLLAMSSFPMFLNEYHHLQFLFVYDQNLNLVTSREHPHWTEFKESYLQAAIMPMRTFDLGPQLVFYEMYQNGRFYKTNTQKKWSIDEWLSILLENSLSDDMLLQSVGSSVDDDHLDGHHLIQSVVGSPRYLFLTINEGSIFTFKSVLIDTQNNTITGIQDFAGYNRFWDDLNGFFSFWPSGYLSGTNEAYDYSYDPGKMEQEYQEALAIAPDFMHRADSSVLDLFDTAKRMGNPVIQLVKLK